MYIDGVIIFSLVVVALIIAMMVYLYRYARKHIDMDVRAAESAEKQREQMHKEVLKA